MSQVEFLSQRIKMCLISLCVAGGTEVLFSFDVGTERVELIVRSPAPLNDDKWHRVEAEKNVKEAGLQLDGQYREVRPTPPQGHTKLDFYSDLYIGETYCVHHIHSL